MTCKDKINDVFYRFPRPRDCNVGSFGAWSGCSKKCGGGIKTRTRKVIYPAKFGGQQCPPLVNKRVCNTQTCTNPNFTKQSDSGFYDSNKLKFLGWNPRKGTGGLIECQGDCDSNKDCASGLKCFQRNGYQKVPGCVGRGKRGAAYCISNKL